jgi:predicted ester cyclase
MAAVTGGASGGEGLEANNDLARRFYAEAINGRDSGACDRLLTRGFVHNGEGRGRGGQRAAVDYFLAAFPDLRHEVELILAEGDLVAAHQRWRGTHGGEFMGVAATGRAVDFTSTAVLRIEGGQIAEAWDEVDVAGLMAQLR